MPYDGIYKCPDDDRAIMIYNILRNRPITVLAPITDGVKVIECHPGVYDGVSSIVHRVNDEYTRYYLDYDALVRSLREGRLNDARAIGDVLGGVFGGAFTSLLSTIIGKVRRGGRLGVEDLEGLYNIIHEVIIRRIYAELSRQYTILDAGKYAIVTNGPPGVYKLPESPVEVDGLLASLGLGVLVKESIDIDVVFSNILRTANSDYARVLLDAYLRLRPVNIQLDGLKPWLIPMIVRSLENGHLTIIRGNRLYEYPSIIVNQDNVLDAFNDILEIGWV